MPDAPENNQLVAPSGSGQEGDRPKVSVAMITYNHEKFIGQAIESVLMQQTTFDYELVIGEDCSTDGTRGIVTDYQKKYPGKIRVLMPDTNFGMLRNFAQTLNSCRGQYVALLEGDDYWTSPDKLQKQVDFLEKHPECAISFHSTRVLYEDQSRKDEVYPEGEQKEISTIEDLFTRNFMSTCSVMFRRALFGELPDWYYSLELGDWPLHILNAQHGHIGYINEVMATYRVHHGSGWSSRGQYQAYLASAKMLELMDSYLGFKYDKYIRETVTDLYYQLARLSTRNGKYHAARQHAAKYLEYQPSPNWAHPADLWHSALMLSLRNVPVVYRILVAIKSIHRRQGAAL